MDRRRLALWLTMAWGAGSRRIEAALAGVRDPERFTWAVRQNRREEGETPLSPEAAARLRRVEEDAVTAMLRALDARGFEMLERGDGRYPERLAQIPGAPPLLFVEGNLDGLDEEDGPRGGRHPADQRSGRGADPRTRARSGRPGA